jgi:Zn-dependent alcohol dehydrogenase
MQQAIHCLAPMGRPAIVGIGSEPQSIDISRVVTRTVPLEASAINDAFDALERYEGGVRTVIVP